jgi:hypothetical protein
MIVEMDIRRDEIEERGELHNHQAVIEKGIHHNYQAVIEGIHHNHQDVIEELEEGY